MNAEQKQRAADLLSAWQATAYALHGDRMADLLQELVDAPEVLAATNPAQISSSAEPVLVVEVEPGYWSRGSYYEGSKPHINPTEVWELPIGTNLYTSPPAAPSVPDVEPVAYVTGVYGGHTTVAPIDAAQVLRVGMALYTAPQHPADVARDAERLDWLLRKLPGVVLRYCVGVLSDTSDGKEFREAIDAAIERQGGE